MIYEGVDQPMFLPGVESAPKAAGAYADLIQAARSSGSPVSQIWSLFAFNPEATKHLERFTHAVMRGEGPLTPGMRELIAAFTSRRNHCLY